ncbi:MAG: hypothetical protein JW759_00535 [Candidatus Coatesbacteria bacterium]|nr:hypothetical protein [Candidatus Coatesbacteria bacterium]
MTGALAEMTEAEFKALVQKTVDKRMSVWLTQLMDALIGADEEGQARLKPEFAESLRRSIAEAEAGDLTDLRSLRQSLGE